MKDEYVATLVLKWNGFENRLTQKTSQKIISQLKSLSDDMFLHFLHLNCKSPLLTLLLAMSFGLLGIDRFYVGDIGRGLTKLILTIIIVGLPISLVWWFIDIFLTYKRCKIKNGHHLESNILF